MPWVYINRFEGGEKKLNRSCVIAVTSGVQNLGVLLLEECQHLLTLMVSSIVQKEYMIIFPLRSEPIQGLDQFLEENHHIFAVCIGLE